MEAKELEKKLFRPKKNGWENTSDEEKEKILDSFKRRNNKIKDLRNVLNEDNHSIVRFLENCPEVENILKDELQKEDVGASDLWQYMKNEKILKTRYVDAIELIDFSLKV